MFSRRLRTASAVLTVAALLPALAVTSTATAADLSISVEGAPTITTTFPSSPPVKLKVDNLDGTPSGKVSLVMDGAIAARTDISTDGTATLFPIDPRKGYLPVGSHTLTAFFGDSQTNPYFGDKQSAPFQIQVNKGTPNVFFEVSPQANDTVDFRVAVLAPGTQPVGTDPVGTVQLLIDGEPQAEPFAYVPEQTVISGIPYVDGAKYSFHYYGQEDLYNEADSAIFAKGNVPPTIPAIIRPPVAEPDPPTPPPVTDPGTPPVADPGTPPVGPGTPPVADPGTPPAPNPGTPPVSEVGTTPPSSGSDSQPVRTTTGYRIVENNGVVNAYGQSQFFGDASGLRLNSPIISSAATADDGGYWLLGQDGGIFNYGNAKFFGSMGGKALNKAIVGLAPTSTGNGYWLVASDGGVFAFGDAGFYGSMGGKPLNKPVVGITPAADGRGYRMVASDGGIFAFGSAAFHGSMGGQSLNKPVVGMTTTPDGNGYWMVASDGGIFAFGTAGFYGSAGSLTLNKPIVGMRATASGAGYWFVASDGGVFAYGNAAFSGSAAGSGKSSATVALS